MVTARRRDPPVPAAAYSIQQFCQAHGISQSTYFKMKSNGEGPREFRACKRVLISYEAAAAWRRERELMR